MSNLIKLVVLLAVIVQIQAAEWLNYDKETCKAHEVKEDCEKCCTDNKMAPNFYSETEFEFTGAVTGHFQRKGRCHCKILDPMIIKDRQCIMKSYTDSQCSKCCSHRTRFVIERNYFHQFECHCRGDLYVEGKKD